MEDPANNDLPRSFELVRQAQGGDFTALNTLMERYYARVRRIVRLRLGEGLRRHLESSDILQETFIAAVHDFERFEMREEASLIQWLAKIAQHKINAAADYHYAAKRDRKREVAMQFAKNAQESGEIVYDPKGEEQLPLDDLVEKEQIATIEDCLRDLREDYREAILVRDYAGASWSGLALALDSPSSDAARMTYARAITELSRLVRKRGAP